jgi:hypothetical protein
MKPDNETWKCADPELEKQIRCFPYIARSVVERLQAILSMPLNDRGISDYFVPGSKLSNCNKTDAPFSLWNH